MKYGIFALIGWITLAVAGQQPNDVPTYQAEVYSAALKRGIVLPQVDIEFGTPTYVPEQNMSTVAECKLGDFHTHSRIVISQVEYSRLSVSRRRQLIYHELGHCALGLKHTKDGLMAAENIERDYSIDELFH